MISFGGTPIRPEGLLEELRETNEMEARAKEPFRLLHALREGRERERVIAQLRQFLGSPRAQWVSNELNALRSAVVAAISKGQEVPVDAPLLAEAIMALDHVEYIVQSGKDPESTKVASLSWCDEPLIRV